MGICLNPNVFPVAPVPEYALRAQPLYAPSAFGMSAVVRDTPLDAGASVAPLNSSHVRFFKPELTDASYSCS